MYSSSGIAESECFTGRTFYLEDRLSSRQELGEGQMTGVARWGGFTGTVRPNRVDLDGPSLVRPSSPEDPLGLMVRH